ncbi:hypothetical protein GCM10025778_25600 [Paeniglutamicibacter antarcticus]|uniref:Uncharacterized protein n=1 Tax=Paeniglutamicibacter antarcticus TaxID=494023 RepID=A0ABP9TQR6_9MICC
MADRGLRHVAGSRTAAHHLWFRDCQDEIDVPERIRTQGLDRCRFVGASLQKRIRNQPFYGGPGGWPGDKVVGSESSFGQHRSLEQCALADLPPRVLGKDTLPLYSSELLAGGRKRARPPPNGKPVAVYVPACVNTMFGPADPSQAGIQESFSVLAARTGVELLLPEAIDSLCCGTPFSSSGMDKGHAGMGGAGGGLTACGQQQRRAPDPLRRLLLHGGPAPLY